MKKLLIICLAGISGILTTACQEKKTEKITVNWATFNIRYDNPADSLNNWKYRKDTVAAFIKANQLDIVGMQEVLHNQLEDLKQRLPEYAEVGSRLAICVGSYKYDHPFQKTAGSSWRCRQAYCWRKA